MLTLGSGIDFVEVRSFSVLPFPATRTEGQALFETHYYFSSSVPINQIILFKQKMRVCLNRNLNK